MAYKKRWEIPFKSLNGTSCRIDILKNGYTGDTYEVISNGNLGWPAEDPFYFEEDDSDNLLDVIRTKTGYIRLIENNHGDLNALFPQLNTDHYVRFYYDNTLAFTGYIRAESFGLEWGELHRRIDLPVISPLELADGMSFTPPTNPEYRTVGKWLYEVINGLDAYINRVEFPDPENFRTQCIMNLYLCSLALCPQNYEWGNKSDMSEATDFYEGKSYRYFLEGLCNAFGLIVRDEPGKLVFSRYDYTGKYSSSTKSGLNSTQSRTQIVSSDYTEFLPINISSEDNEENTILPLSRITVDGEGEYYQPTELPTEVCSRSTNGGNYNGKYYGKFTPLNDLLTAYNTGANVSPVTGRLSGSGTMIAFDGSAKVLCQKSSGETGVRTLVKFKLFNNPTKFTFNTNFGNTIENLDNPTTAPTLHVFIKRNNQYWTQDYVWSTSDESINVGFKGSHSIYIPQGSTLYPTEIWFTSDMQYWSSDYIYVIDSIRIDENTSAIDEWYNGERKAQKIINGTPSDSEASITRAFSRQWQNSNHLSSSTFYISEPSEPTYPYLTAAQRRLQLNCKGTIPDYHYMKQLYFAGNLWRLIAMAFHPWDDEYKLTLHTSDQSFFYFYLDPVNATSFTFIKASGVTGDLYYSTDRNNWTQMNSGTATELFYSRVKVYFRGNLTPGQNGVGTFSSDQPFNAGGDIISLFGMNNFSLPMADYACKSLFSGSKVIDASDILLPTTLSAHCYEFMFSGCTRLATLPRLTATTLADSCYASMFSGCTSLSYAPELPVTTLANSCYASMFSGCTSLDNAPDLPATTLANNCYESMFSGCTSLSQAPGLRAATLVNSCYASMFSGCTNLGYVLCLATNISATNCVNNWLYNVYEAGIFVKALSMQGWPTGASGIPSGWEVEDYEIDND